MRRNRPLEHIHGQQSAEPPSKRRLQSSEVTIEILPVDVLLQVAKCLPIAQWPDLERVSRKFRDAICEAWRTIRKVRLGEDLVATDPRDSNLVLEKLTRRAINITDLGGFEQCSLNEASIDLLIRFEKLERIEFGTQHMSLDDLEKFLKESASRGRLKLVNAADSLVVQTAPGPRPLFEAFSEEGGFAPLKLETFNLSKSFGFSWSFLNVVDISKLTSFFVTNTHVNRSLLASFLNCTTNLQRLAFSFDCYLDEQRWDERRMHDKGPEPSQPLLQLNKQIIRAVSNLERLESLKMKTARGAAHQCDCRNFDVEMTQMFNDVGRRSTLTKLSLLRYLATSAVLSSVATALPSLHSLELFVDNGADDSATAVLRAQNSLVNLRLDGEHEIPVIRIIRGVMVSALHLKSLRLNHFSNHMLKKNDLLKIAAFKELNELLVQHCIWESNVDDEVLDAWGQAFGAELASLVIPYCPKVTVKGVLALIKRTPRLQTLDISFAKVTDRCLKEMATQCREIRKLNLCCCRAITVEGVQAIIDGCVYLNLLHIGGNFPWFPGGLRVERYRNILFRKVYKPKKSSVIESSTGYFILHM